MAEEYEQKFRELFPEYTVKNSEVCLSPYIDIFEAGIEIATKELREEPKKNHWYEMYELECLKTKDLEKQIKKGRNIVHRLLVVIQEHKWWNYTVIDEARAFMSEVDRDKDND